MLKNATFLLASAVVLAALPASFARAQVVIAPSTPQIGSSNPVTAAPLVARPSTKPCIVPLFSNLAFDNFTPASFNYTPPSDCKGPWSKVVFTADFTVSEGRQFDRTASFYLGHASIYYGTTAEPRAALSPSWHVERDVTDLSAIFKSDQTGEANIGNFVGVSGGVTYSGIIYANAALEFYPASWRDPAPAVPDVVVPVNGSGGDAGTLNTTTDSISQTLNLPENVESVYLDVISQNQSNDEFYYFCVPNDQANNLLSCGNTAFRETEIAIDGKPAGVAPVYPWIFTGGIDTALWEPIPGNQTLDFKPYRVNLTPFAGLLSDGNAHTVAISVFNANSYFLATANLLVYEDHNGRKVTGGVMENTLSAAPDPTTDENIAFNSKTGEYTGTISVGSKRSFAIKGYVNTSHGRVETTVQQNVNFINTQEFDVNPVTEAQDLQNVQQNTTVDSYVTTRIGLFARTSEEHFAYPLNLNYHFWIDASGNELQNTSVDQKFTLTKIDRFFGIPDFASQTVEETKAQDDINFSTGATSNNTASQTYKYEDSRGGCYSETLTATNKVLTDVSKKGCRHE
jgi:Peptide N-acetyl-beta-D-glucosaminyl asparaginase amidase A